MLTILKLLTWTESGLQPIADEIFFGTIGALLAFFGAYRYHRITGRNPWKIPSPIWAILAFFSPVGFILGLIARSISIRKNLGNTNDLYQYRDHMNESFMNNVSQPLPDHNLRTDVNPVNAQPETAGYSESTHLPLFGWYPDVYGKYKYRYWDGKAWTKFVSDGQFRSIDKDFS